MNILPNQIVVQSTSEQSESNPVAPRPLQVIAHPNFRRAYTELDHFFRYSESKLIFVVGPSGAGKTTLKNLLRQKLEKEFSELPRRQRRGRIATVSANLPSPTRGSFSFSPVLYTLLSQLRLKDLQHVERPSRWGGEDVVAHFSKVFARRRPLACFLDEGQNLSLVGHSRHLINNLALLNRLADATSIKFILFGTYDLVEAMNSYVPLGRRVDIVKIEAYRHDELNAFLNIAWDVFKDLGIEVDLTPENDGDFLFERSLGAIGLLRKWVQLAAIEPRLAGRKLTRADLEKSSLHLPLLQSMMLDICYGKDIFRETTEDRNRLNQMILDLGPQVSALPVIHAKKTGQRLKPGVRKLERYLVGNLIDQVRAAEG